MTLFLLHVIARNDQRKNQSLIALIKGLNASHRISKKPKMSIIESVTKGVLRTIKNFRKAAPSASIGKKKIGSMSSAVVTQNSFAPLARLRKFISQSVGFL
jgi:hypothetical protein